MKKTLLLIMTLLLIVAFAACGNPDNDVNSPAPDSQQPPAGNTEAENQDNEITNESSDRTLVVYFSATGNTRQVANYIASATQGDLFELVPVEPYSDADLDWNDDNSRVAYEHNNADARNVALVAATVDNFDSYDTVFIGYPIWWGIAAWPVNSFVTANDFSGKIVIPFCTSASSGIGDSGAQLAAAAGSGNWLEGIRFSSGVSESEVTQWVESLNY